MVRSMTSAVSGLRTHQTRLDVIGNNIANVNTYGFKSARVLFRDALYQTTQGSTNGGTVFGGSNATQYGYGTNVGSVDTLWVGGAFGATDLPLDCFIDGSGFFLVGPKSGAMNTNNVDNLYLTRVGAFEFDNDGYLTTASGYHVYGFNNLDYTQDPPTYNQNQVSEIRIPLDANGVPLELTDISIADDGTITGMDGNQKPVVIGKIALANVPNESGLENVSGSMYRARANTGNVTAYMANQNGTGKLVTGGLEMSNVDLSKEFTDMITTQRGFQANSRIISVTDEMLNELVNLKR